MTPSLPPKHFVPALSGVFQPEDDAVVSLFCTFKEVFEYYCIENKQLISNILVDIVSFDNETALYDVFNESIQQIQADLCRKTLKLLPKDADKGILLERIQNCICTVIDFDSVCAQVAAVLFIKGEDEGEQAIRDVLDSTLSSKIRVVIDVDYGTCFESPEAVLNCLEAQLPDLITDTALQAGSHADVESVQFQFAQVHDHFELDDHESNMENLLQSAIDSNLIDTTNLPALVLKFGKMERHEFLSYLRDLMRDELTEEIPDTYFEVASEEEPAYPLPLPEHQPSDTSRFFHVSNEDGYMEFFAENEADALETFAWCHGFASYAEFQDCCPEAEECLEVDLGLLKATVMAASGEAVALMQEGHAFAVVGNKSYSSCESMASAYGLRLKDFSPEQILDAVDL